MAAVLSSDRLEVSVDGLTLSPNAEVPPCEARPAQGEPAAGRSRAGPGSPGAAEAGGEAAEEAALSLERRWGFALEELYGLALRFFKGEPGRWPGPHRPLPGTGAATDTGELRAASPAGPGCGAQAEPRVPREPRGAAPGGLGVPGRAACPAGPRGCAFPGAGREPGPGAEAAPGCRVVLPGVCSSPPKIGATELGAGGTGGESSQTWARSARRERSRAW